MMVLSATRDTTTTGEAGTAKFAPCPNRLSKKSEKAATSGTAWTAAGKLEPGIPTRRRPELLAGAPVPQLVVGRALFGILEHLVGLTGAP